MPSGSKKIPFAHYARYYDLLYGGKDYTAESRFVHQQLDALGAPGRDLLELGCGTGRHAAAFAGLGWRVTGVDLSPTMIAQARQRAAKSSRTVARQLKFAVGDVRTFRTRNTYDAAISLFHVLGYQTSIRGMNAALRTAALHLRPGGIFFFDYWYGPAVLADRPSIRVKRFEDECIAVTRTSVPTLDLRRHVVRVDFAIQVEDKQTRKASRIHERHRVRYFFLPELEQWLAGQGFKVAGHGKWMSREPLDARSWYGWIAARRL